MDILASWHTQAGVRSQSRRVFTELRDEHLLLFPPELVPYREHPLLDTLWSEHADELLAQHLYQYLWFTVHFETSIVNRLTQKLAVDGMHLPIARSVREDALKIYTDEGYHALFSVDLITQIEAASGTKAHPYRFDNYLRRVDRVALESYPGRQDLGQFLQVVIFETTITSLLSEIPKRVGLASAVRDTVADHAKDERFHHAFFARLFKEFWANLSEGERGDIARSLPRLMDACLEPYTEPVFEILRSFGVADQEARAVVADSYADKESTRRAARHTIHLFEEVGAFSDSEANESLHQLNLR